MDLDIRCINFMCMMLDTFLMMGFVTSFGCTLSGEHVSLGKFLQVFTIFNDGYCLTTLLQTSLGWISQFSLGILIIKVFSISSQTLFSTTRGQACVVHRVWFFWSHDVLGITFKVVIFSLLQTWNNQNFSKV